MNINGRYIVFYKYPNRSRQDSRLGVFEGYCENFAPSGKCVFSNENGEMLIIEYQDIIQMCLERGGK